MAIKFNRIRADGEILKEFVKLDDNNNSEQTVKELLLLYENLDTDVFSDLTPSIKKTAIMSTDLYKMTRGVYDVLNITKLYNLYAKNKQLFTNYIEK